MSEDFRAFPDLDHILSVTSQKMQEMNLMSFFEYEFESGHILDMGEPILTRPSYCLNIILNDRIILKVHYELDTRFGLEVNVAEIGRIENLLVDRCISVLTWIGVSNLHRSATSNVVPQSILRETDDKKNLGLN